MNRLFLSVSVALSATTCSFAQQITQPNLVLFIADDCSYYDLGCYGSVDSKTPNIDNFATQGVRFTQAYQAAPMSSPTRHNLYTGLWPVGSMLLQSQYFPLISTCLVKRGNYILKLFRNLSLIAKGKASRFACLLLPISHIPLGIKVMSHSSIRIN